MGKYISQNDLNLLYSRNLKSIGKEGIQSEVNSKRNENEPEKFSKTIFLSHSHLDKNIVNKIGLLFNRLQIELYIDWLDKSLPETPNRDTASIIIKKIQKSHRFLFLATFNGLRSRWCNWEVGVADAYRKDESLAILPIRSKSGNWRKNEYLQLYPEMIIETENLDSITVEMVSISLLNGDRVSLKNWLAG